MYMLEFALPLRPDPRHVRLRRGDSREGGDCAVFARVDLPLSAAFAFARFALLVLPGLCVVTGLFGFLVFLLFREMVFYFTNIFFNFLFC